ncbi:hypothetical protein DQ04_01451100 [Trypanosoma grayi]|uniref:hypothetical protein n=1 Tax=Trypanosoma grayi TaxID=71804 RepID=UPI0004F41F9D|nr:hypothetical protein DQ04_01451100 [Trypanosoma grayi]KEG12751.1 hypothetical protein DQ04_01451100 [Trypanosoma grayi]
MASMSQQEHLGVICVDVSELLKEHARLKVERRDNMLLYNGSYLITDPLPPATPRASSTAGGRTPSTLPSPHRPSTFRVKSLNKRRSRSRDKGRVTQKSRSRSRSGSSNNPNKQCSENSSSEHMPTPEPPVGSSPSTTANGYSSTILVQRSILPTLNEASGAGGSCTTGWQGDARLYTPLGDIDDGSSQQTSRASRDSRRVVLLEDSVDGTSVAEAQQQPQQQPSECESPLSEGAARALRSVMASMQQRIWAKAQRVNEPLSGDGSDGVTLTHGDNDGRSSSMTGSGYAEPAPLAMIGTLGVASLPSTPDAWGDPRKFNSSGETVAAPRRRVANTERAATRPNRLRDARGTERMVLLGIVPSLPKPVPPKPLPSARGGFLATLPPAFRRVARNGTAPTNRPKRF